MAMDIIDYKIFGNDTQFVEVELDPGEAAVGEAGAMMYMEDGIAMDTVFGDGSSQQRGFWGKLVAFDAGVAAGLIPLAAIGIAASVIGAFYYLKVIKVMYFDEPADAIAASDSPARMVLVAMTALFVSPLGYFATLALSPVTAGAAKALFWAA